MATKDKLINLEDLKVLSDHVEGEVTDLKSDLSELNPAVFNYDEIPLTLASWTTPGWYASNGNKYTTSGYVNSHNEVVPSARYNLHYFSYYDSTYAILDENDNILSVGSSADSIGSANHQSWFDETIEIPENGKYLALSSGGSGTEVLARDATTVNRIVKSTSKVEENASKIEALEEIQKNQIEAVADSLNKEFSEPYTLTMNANSVLLNSTGEIHTESSLAGFEASNKVEIIGNRFYRISASTQYAGNIYYAFYDEDGAVIEKSENGGASESIINRAVYAPAEAKYISIAKSPNYPTPSLVGMGEIDILNAIEIGYQPIEFTTIPHSCVSSSWTIIDAGSFVFYVASISVVGQKTVRITSATNYGNPKWAWRNASGGIISIESAGASGLVETVGQIVNVPNGASELLVNCYAKNPTIIELIKTTEKRKWLDKTWALIGDSLTNYNQRAYKHYFTYINWKTGINIANYGVSDTGYAKGINNNNAFYQIAENINTDYDVLTIFGSFNDLASGLPLGTKTDSSNTTIAGCINLCIDNILANKPLAKIGIVSPCPWEQYTPMGNNEAAVNYVNMIKTIAEYRGIPYLDLFYASSLRPWDEQFRQLAYSMDEGSGTHPDDKGHEIIAPMFEFFLDKLILS